MIFLLLNVACFSFDPRTRLEELQIVAVQSNPAEISPSAGMVDINVLIADPKNKGAEVLLWSCTDFGEGCLEADFFAESTEGWVQSFVYDQPLHTVSFFIPPVLAPIVQQLPEELIPFTGSSLWILACEPGVCDVFRDAEDGTLSYDFLSDPRDVVATLEMGTYALAKKNLLISERPLESRVQNPEITATFAEEELVVAPNTEKELVFSYALNSSPDSDPFLYGYSAAGYFVEGPPRGYDGEEIPQEGEWSLTWQGLEQAEEGNMYVVLENGEGGIGVWLGGAKVE